VPNRYRSFQPAQRAGKTAAVALLLAITTGCSSPGATVEDWQGHAIDSSNISLARGISLVSSVPVGSNGQVRDPNGRSQIVVFKSVAMQHPDIQALIISSSKSATTESMVNFAADWQLPHSGVVGDNAASLAQAVDAAKDAVTTVLVEDGHVIRSWSNRVVLAQEIDAALTDASVTPGSTPTTAP
jgi:hypothetical protein